MDFLVGLPNTKRHFKSIWVIMDRMTKSSHFIPMKSTYRAEDYVILYIYEILSLHGIPLSIISNRIHQFTSHLWKSFQKILGTQVKLSASFHSQTNGQVERTIQKLEDMLRGV